MTRINSTRVNARTRRCSLLLIRLLPVRNVIIGSFTSIRPDGNDVVGAGVVFAGTHVDVRVAPGVVGDAALVLQVGTMPTLGISRLLYEVHQAALGFGIVSVVRLKHIQRRLEGGNVGLRVGFAGTLARAGELGQADGRHGAEK